MALSVLLTFENDVKGEISRRYVDTQINIDVSMQLRIKANTVMVTEDGVDVKGEVVTTSALKSVQ